MQGVELVRTTAVALLVAAALACNTSRQRNATDDGATPRAEGSARADADGEREVSLMGCLQEGSGRNSYILTGVNQPVGTGGDVTQDRFRAARQSYRLEPEGKVDLEPHVGKQVRVTGRLTDEGEVQTSAAGSTDGSNERRERATQEPVDIDQGDLARVEVSAVSVAADGCR